jgi:hypothetical protein
VIRLYTYLVMLALVGLILLACSDQGRAVTHEPFPYITIPQDSDGQEIVFPTYKARDWYIRAAQDAGIKLPPPIEFYDTAYFPMHRSDVIAMFGWLKSFYALNHISYNLPNQDCDTFAWDFVYWTSKAVVINRGKTLLGQAIPAVSMVVVKQEHTFGGVLGGSGLHAVCAVVIYDPDKAYIDPVTSDLREGNSDIYVFEPQQVLSRPADQVELILLRDYPNRDFIRKPVPAL